MTRVGKALRLLAIGLFLVLAAGLIAFQVADRPLPTGTAGADAEALADRMLAAIDHPAWQRTGAVRWTFRGAHQHLWDRQRQRARVRWGDTKALIDLTTRTGVASQAGQPMTGDEATAAVDKAWALWVNDSFWLNPISKLRDPGTERHIIPRDDGDQDLLVTYDLGGVTPGDSYLWTLGENDLPTTWRMWVKIIPLGGLSTTWGGWLTLDTGARVATEHRIGGFLPLRLTDVAGATTLAELEPGPDPFAALDP